MQPVATVCDRCGIAFTGKYRQGNLARHVRLKHNDGKGSLYLCNAEGCSRVFQRQDARLKHERSRRPDLPHLSAPQSRSRSNHRYDSALTSQRRNDEPSRYSIAQSFVGDNDGGEVAPISVDEFEYHILSRLPPVAWKIFLELYSTLDECQWASRCDALFLRWTTMARSLKEQGCVIFATLNCTELTIGSSTAYSADTRALADIHVLVEAIECGMTTTFLKGGHQQCHPGNAETTSGLGHGFDAQWISLPLSATDGAFC